MDADMQIGATAPPVPGPTTPPTSSAPSAASLATDQDEKVAKLEADVAQLREVIAKNDNDQREAAQRLADE
eukprot:14382673-Alexandrium_andersonii.AAC.1